MRGIGARWLCAGGLVVAMSVGFAPGVAYAPTTPSAPRSPSGIAGRGVGAVMLSWVIPSSTGGGIGTYLYDVSTNYNPISMTGTFSGLHDLQRTVTKATVPCPAVYPAVCTYRLYARNAAGTSVASPVVTVPWSVPLQPRTAKATSSNFVDATITWGPPSNTGGLTVTYDVDVSNDLGTSWTNLVSGLSVLTYSAPGSCTNGTACEYRVWADNAVGTSVKSSNIAKVNVAPGYVRSLAVTHNSDDVTTGNTTSGTASFTITWIAPMGGLHNGPDQLEECTNVCSSLSTSWSSAISIAHGTLTATRTCPAGAITCTYRVRATNTRGGDGPWQIFRYAPTAPVQSALVTGSTSGTVSSTFNGPQATGPATTSSYYGFKVCQSGCSTSGNWSTSATTVSYPPASVPTTADVACPTAGASCSVRVYFVNDQGKASMVSSAFTATAAP